jgi:hypothetical protein
MSTLLLVRLSRASLSEEEIAAHVQEAEPSHTYMLQQSLSTTYFTFINVRGLSALI